MEEDKLNILLEQADDVVFLPFTCCDAMERIERFIYRLIPFVVLARVISLCL